MKPKHIKKSIVISYIVLASSFFCIDQFLKYIARAYPEKSILYFYNLFGWEFFSNTGIAFSIPVPHWFVLLLTPLLLFFVFLWYRSIKKKTSFLFFAFVLLCFGAISNFVDRMLFGFTTDYLRLFTSVINIADIMIVFGVVFMYLETQLSQSVKKPLTKK
jgi:signal peptidase II